MTSPTRSAEEVPFNTRRLPSTADEIAPDGSDVRILLALKGGSMAHFQLAAGQVSKAIVHKTVEEVWFVLGGRGEMWRKKGNQEEITPVESEISLTFPCGTHFQFRAFGDEALTAVGVTIPPWPGMEEAVVVEGIWKPTVS